MNANLKKNNNRSVSKKYKNEQSRNNKMSLALTTVLNNINNSSNIIKY